MLPSLAHQIPHPIGENITHRAQGFLLSATAQAKQKSAASRWRLEIFAGAVSCKVEEGSRQPIESVITERCQEAGKWSVAQRGAGIMSRIILIFGNFLFIGTRKLREYNHRLLA